MKTSHRILVADDNVEFCANVVDILELKGYQVVAVHDGIQALEAVKEDGFELVLMDIKMPVMNGVEAFKKLKEIAPETPVIMMTAYAVEELIQEALREGAFGAFHKPIDFEKLVSSIERALPGGALIMVVDDNRELRANLRDVLTEKGYRVNLAQDGQVAVQMARENNPDVVLLDMKMPAMNGLETYLAIQDIRPDLVVIVITGYLGELGDLAQQAVEKGAYVCLEKPLDMDRLLELLHRLVELRSGGLLEEGTE